MNKLITCFSIHKITHSKLKCILITRHTRKRRISVPGGDMVLSSVDGIVISITGLLDGKPFSAS